MAASSLGRVVSTSPVAPVDAVTDVDIDIDIGVDPTVVEPEAPSSLHAETRSAVARAAAPRALAATGFIEPS
jgi:hypothetical protein